MSYEATLYPVAIRMQRQSARSQKTEFTATRKVDRNMTSITSLILSVFIWLAVGAITANFAKKRGRDPYVWFFIGMLLGIFGILALFIMPSLKTDAPAEEARVEPMIIEELPQEPKKLFHLKDWHCIDTEKVQRGPLSFRELKSLWNKGQLLPHSYVWTEGMTVWLPIEKIPNLEDSLKE